MNQSRDNQDKDTKKKSNPRDRSLSTIGDKYDLRQMLKEKGITLKDEKNIKSTGI